MTDTAPQFALYYPGSGAPLSWIKNALLFYDGVALFTSDNLESTSDHFVRSRYRNLEYISHDLIVNDVVTTIPAKSILSGERAKFISFQLVDAINSGLIQDASHLPNQPTRSINPSKIGIEDSRSPISNIIQRDEVLRFLFESGHIKINPNSVNSIRVSQSLFGFLSVFHSQVLVSAAPSLGVSLVPSTDTDAAQNAILRICRFISPSTPSVYDEISLAGIDLTEIPVSEILAFKKEMQPAFQRYRDDLARDMAISAGIAPESRAAFFDARRISLIHDIENAQDIARKEWKRYALVSIPLSLSASVVGVLLASHLDLGLGGEISAAVLSTLTPSLLPQSNSAATTSYLFQAKSRFAQR